MSDIDKIQLIHDVQQKFTISDDIVANLIGQIEDGSKKENIERFFRGYSIEDNFQHTISALPWVRLAHQLDQSQFPSTSKSEFQVPDYQLFFEDFDRICHPLLVEIKSVTGKKKSLKIPKKQIQSCSNYANTSSHPLVYGIYWTHWNIWTINTTDQFEEKSKTLKITIEEAIKNDLSVIFGNVTYFIPPLTRVRICDSSVIDELRPRHGDYGVIIADSLSVNGRDFVPLSVVDSSVLDSYFAMNVEQIETSGDRTKVIEKTGSTHCVKVLAIVMAHLTSIGEALDDKDSRYSFFFIHEFLNKMGFSYSYSVPNKHTKMSMELYNIAFKGTPLAV